ncbi:fibrinogen-like protein 1 [Ruditapes philippinarum]|uniref:fibrinogen-like protein 1 n=1 Tax=Ruditapes philippinarum TaxID=129788 RepID=UPI00295BDFBA|nr:fibrinogen-like protein 1 [Ruditapes philippinarum]
MQASRCRCRSVALLMIIVYCSIITQGQLQDTASICQTLQYRALSLRHQNEHQCLMLEKLNIDLDKEKSMIRVQYQDLYTMISKFRTDMFRNVASLSTPRRDSPKSIPNFRDIPLVRDCSELQMNGISLSGVYPIRLPNRKIVNIWCDMEDKEDSGWTIIQKRIDGKINFTRRWDDYSFGFGNVNSEYWFGNDNLYWMTHYKNYSIRFDMWDWEDNYAYALYDYFRVENEQMDFQLTIQGYSGTAGDAMFPYHNGMRFSTIDKDNDEWHLSCAKKDQSGWWFKACGYASLNGIFIENGISEPSPDGVIKGIIWSKWRKEYGYSLKRTEIKIKPRTKQKLDDAISRQETTKAGTEVTEAVPVDNEKTETLPKENIKSNGNGVTVPVIDKDKIAAPETPTDSTPDYYTDEPDYYY